MANGKKKLDSKTLGKQKHMRRQWMTFLRMCRYGVNNFTRNAWLTIAATAIMTITLFVVFVSVASNAIMTNTIDQLRDKVSMSIYLKTDTTQLQADNAAQAVRELPSVMSVSVRSPEQARSAFIEDNKADIDTIEATKEATNSFPWTLSVKVVNINDTSQLADIVAHNKAVTDYVDPDHAPSFAGNRRTAIERIGHVADFARRIGIIASTVFIAISTLIIFNTIRMAIFNRREEIQMMKLIGAERSFIRGPFLVEAVVYGFFAALIATGLGFGLLLLSAPALATYEINIQPTIDLMTYYAGFVLLAMIGLGALIGIISSSLATRRYLRK